MVAPSSRAAAAPGRAQHFLEAGEQPPVAAARRQPDLEPPRLALAQLVDRRELLRVDAPVVDEFVVTELSLDHEYRVAHEHGAMLLPDVVEQAHLDARAAIVEHQRHARAAALHLEHEPGHRHRLAAAEALLAGGPRTAEVDDARRRHLPELLLELRDRVPRQEQAERLALAGEALRLAPLRHLRVLDPHGKRGALVPARLSIVL